MKSVEDVVDDDDDNNLRVQWGNSHDIPLEKINDSKR